MNEESNVNKQEKKWPFLVAILVLAALTTASLVAKSQVAKLSDIETITMSRIHCESTCSNYELSINSRGTINLKVIDSEGALVNKTAEISEADFNRLKVAIAEIGFYSLTTNFSEPGKHNIDGQCENNVKGIDKLVVLIKNPLGVTYVKHALDCSVLPIHRQFVELGDFIGQIAGISKLLEKQG